MPDAIASEPFAPPSWALPSMTDIDRDGTGRPRGVCFWSRARRVAGATARLARYDSLTRKGWCVDEPTAIWFDGRPLSIEQARKLAGELTDLAALAEVG